MVKEIIGDIFEEPEFEVIVHQANLYHTFGAGIAAAIKSRFPEAFKADKLTPYGDAAKLGTYSIAQVPFRSSGVDSEIRYVINLYSQTSIGQNVPGNTSYDAMFKGLSAIKGFLIAQNLRLGIPYLMGCGLAGGSWKIVRAIIDEVFENANTIVYIVTLPEVFLAQKDSSAGVGII